jgi:hypothetical protein
MLDRVECPERATNTDGLAEEVAFLPRFTDRIQHTLDLRETIQDEEQGVGIVGIDEEGKAVAAVSEARDIRSTEIVHVGKEGTGVLGQFLIVNSTPANYLLE